MKLFVTGCGYGRCGTTWMQRYLSCYDGVTITGQTTPLPINDATELLRGMRDANESAKHANGIAGYEHHVQLKDDGIVDRVRVFVESVWFKADEVVGCKLNSEHPGSRFLKTLWPDAKYVACIRHPQACFSSLVSTFRPGLTWREFINKWALSVGESVNHKRVFVFQIDRQSPGVFDEMDVFVGKTMTAEGKALIGNPIHAINHAAEPGPFEYPAEALNLMGKLGYEAS